MSRTVFCARLKKEGEGLDFQLYPGELGKRIFDNISKEACNQPCYKIVRSPMQLLLFSQLTRPVIKFFTSTLSRLSTITTMGPFALCPNAPTTGTFTITSWPASKI